MQKDDQEKVNKTVGLFIALKKFLNDEQLLPFLWSGHNINTGEFTGRNFYDFSI